MSREVDNFRVLVILSIATWLLATYVSYNAAPPQAELTAVYDWRGFGQIVPGVVGYRLYWVQSAFTLGGLLGVFFFLRLARGVLVATLVLNPLIIGLGGISVSSPLEDAFWAFYWLFFVLVIGMALFSEPIKVQFNRAGPAHAKSS